MAPTTRSSPTSSTSSFASTLVSRRTSGRTEYTPYNDSLGINRERTKKGCWTCRIRRKKCDEDAIDGRCRACRRLMLDCLGWGSRRPEWMKDKKAVDQRLAQIKQQLASQGMIRGQAKSSTNHTKKHAIRRRQPSPSNSTTTTNVYSPSTATRPPRAAKTQANAALLQPHSSSSSASSPIRTDEEEDAEGSDDEYLHLQQPIDLDDQQQQFHYLHSHNLFEDPSFDDSHLVKYTMDDHQHQRQHHQHQHQQIPSLFDSTSATPSFPGSPLHVPSYPSPFIGSYGIPNLVDSTSIESTFLADHNPHAFASADVSSYGFGNNTSDFDFFSVLNAPPTTQATSATSTATGTTPHVEIPPSTMQPFAVNNGPASPPPILLHGNVTSPHLTSSSNSLPQQTSTPPVGFGITVTNPGGMTMSYENSSGGAFTNLDSYFPGRPTSASPPPGLSDSTLDVVRRNNTPPVQGPPAPTRQRGSRQNTTSVTPRGYFPQPVASTSTSSNTSNSTSPPSTFGSFTIAYKPHIRAPLSDPSKCLTTFQETLVFYYFNRGVRRMQYLLADDSTTGVTDVMYDLVIKDPLGPVTNAICSLSSLHDTRLRIAHGLLHPEDPHAHETAQKLYDDTVLQLSKKEKKFTEVEAIAALHLLSFWLFCGGGGAWSSALQMAGDWLASSDVMNESMDPIEVIEHWPPTHRFAAQGIFWFDIIGACSLKRSPRFIKLYRRMATRNRILLASSSPIPSLFNSQSFQRRANTNPMTSSLMNQVMGCDDDVMFALAEIADLSAWKDRRLKASDLSIKELVSRSQVIEDMLSNTKVVVSPLSSASASRSSTALLSPTEAAVPSFAPAPQMSIPPVWNPYGVEGMTFTNAPQSSPELLDFGADNNRQRSGSMRSTPSITSAGSSSSSSANPASNNVPLSIVTANEPVTLRQLASNVFREAAFLFLYTVVSGCEPGVREVKQSVQSLMDSILAIGSHDLDRSLAFPITIGGCLSETAEHREFFANRLARQGSAVGNGSQAKLLMETVWKRREAGERDVCWKDTMRRLGFDLLLV